MRVWRHVPNLVTASRGLLGLVVAGLLLGPGWNFLAFWVFIAAIVTDLVDGWLARRLDAYSSVGEWLDPLSDKVLTDVSWAALWWVGFAPGWLVAAVLVRDLAVAVGWAWAGPRGLRWRPNAAGQIMVAYEGVALAIFIFHGPWLDVHWPSVGVVLGAIALTLSFVSLIQYLVGGPLPSEPTKRSRSPGGP